MEQLALAKTKMLALTTLSPHGKLTAYASIARQAVAEDPEFYAHLVSWNAIKGEVRDARIALPLYGLRSAFAENASAHLAALDPRSLLKAMDASRAVGAPSRLLRRLLARYLRDLELEPHVGRWERRVLRHRAALKTLYARYHVKPDARSNATILQGHGQGRFAVVRTLAALPAEAAADVIVRQQIPFLIARGALGARAKDPDLLVALIKRMTPTELATNARALVKLGVKDTPAVRAAFEEALAKAAEPGRRKATLKTTRAAEAVEDEDPALAGKLRALQERQLERAGSVEGNWLVLADKSGSMEVAIETAAHVAAVLARLAAGRVLLVLFDTGPRAIEATGWTLEDLKRELAHVQAQGGTSIGCGVQYASEREFPADGIALISDGAENNPPAFATAYAELSRRLAKRVPVYWYLVAGDVAAMARKAGATHALQERAAEAAVQGEREQFQRACAAADIDLQVFDLTGGVDYYSLPNLCLTMRTNRYSLVEEVYATPLLSLDEVLARTKGQEVIGHAERTAQV